MTNYKRWLWPLLILLLVGYLIVDRVWLSGSSSGKGPTKSAREGRRGGPVPVKLMIVRAYDFDDKIIVGGSLASNEEVDLRSESSGKITDITFKEGSRVRKGDLLVKINDKDLQAQHQRALYREQLAQDKERRQRILLEKEAVSQEEYDMALTELNSLKAETQLIRAQIERTEIRAPFDGTVGLRQVSIGEYISPTTVVARLVNMDPIKIDFAIPERYHQSVYPQMPLSFTIDGDARRHTAKVYAIEPKIDLNTRTVGLRAMADNRQAQLLPGLFARVELPVASLRQAMLLPAEALLSEAGGQKVFLWKNGQAEARIVAIGTRSERFVQALSGISLGDTLVVSGILQLREGAALEAQQMVELPIPQSR